MKNNYLISGIPIMDNNAQGKGFLDISLEDVKMSEDASDIIAGKVIAQAIGYTNGEEIDPIVFEGSDVSLTGAGGGGGGTGDLVSVTVSPSISADRELSSSFPINYDSLTPEEKIDGKEIFLIPDQALSEGDEYSYTITPGADWYVNKGGGNFGGQGEAVTLTATVELSYGKPILELPVGIGNAPTIAADKIIVVNITYGHLG